MDNLQACKDSSSKNEASTAYARPAIEILAEGISISTTDFGSGSDVEGMCLLKSLNELDIERLGE